jgi:D-alanyl-D-alanine carboxypeptidase
LFTARTMAQLLRPHWTWNASARNGDTERGLFRQWGLGLHHFMGHSEPGQGDALLPQGGPTAWGHLGEAYGLLSGLLFSPGSATEPSWRLVYAINGTPEQDTLSHGRHSGFTIWEETLFSTVLGLRFSPTS